MFEIARACGILVVRFIYSTRGGGVCMLVEFVIVRSLVSCGSCILLCSKLSSRVRNCLWLWHSCDASDLPHSGRRRTHAGLATARNPKPRAPNLEPQVLVSRARNCSRLWHSCGASSLPHSGRRLTHAKLAIACRLALRDFRASSCKKSSSCV